MVSKSYYNKFMNLQLLSESLIKGNCAQVSVLVKKALREKLKPGVILQKGLICGMDVIGEKFKNKEIFIPEVLVSAKAMHTGLDILKPYLAKDRSKPRAKAVLGTVEGDIHDIGKNIVKIMLEGSGYEVIDLGKDVHVSDFFAAVKEEKPQLLCMSALLTTTMVVMEEVIVYLKKKGVRNHIKILVGGAPLTASYAKKIGADGYGQDAVRGVEAANNLLKLTVAS